jgi:hypothetical protein
MRVKFIFTLIINKTFNFKISKQDELRKCKNQTTFEIDFDNIVAPDKVLCKGNFPTGHLQWKVIPSFLHQPWTCYFLGSRFITLFKSITMLCGTDNILQNIYHIQSECGEYSIEYCQFHRTLLSIGIMLCWLVSSLWLKRVLLHPRPPPKSRI